MWIGSRVKSTPAKSRPTRTISRSASWIRRQGNDGDVEGDGAVEAAALVDLGLLLARETIAAEASSILFGAYFSMKRSPSLALSRCAPSPRAPGDQASPRSVVGWYWIISMSISFAPAR